MEDLAGLAPGRPRGRPLGASTQSCGRRCRVTRNAKITSPPARKRPPPRRPTDAYAECGRPRGRVRRATQISPVSSGLAARKPRQRQPVGGVGRMARNLDAPEGIRREPQADEDDNGEVRSEGSGPQSWARAIRPTPPTGDPRSPIETHRRNSIETHRRSPDQPPAAPTSNKQKTWT